jgi:hypothetical protein
MGFLRKLKEATVNNQSRTCYTTVNHVKPHLHAV